MLYIDYVFVTACMVSVNNLSPSCESSVPMYAAAFI